MLILTSKDVGTIEDEDESGIKIARNAFGRYAWASLEDRFYS
jgi:hypothetical protein